MNQSIFNCAKRSDRVKCFDLSLLDLIHHIEVAFLAAPKVNLTQIQGRATQKPQAIASLRLRNDVE